MCRARCQPFAPPCSPAFSLPGCSLISHAGEEQEEQREQQQAIPAKPEQAQQQQQAEDDEAGPSEASPGDKADKAVDSRTSTTTDASNGSGAKEMAVSDHQVGPGLNLLPCGVFLLQIPGALFFLIWGVRVMGGSRFGHLLSQCMPKTTATVLHRGALCARSACCLLAGKAPFLTGCHPPSGRLQVPSSMQPPAAAAAPGANNEASKRGERCAGRKQAQALHWQHSSCLC